ncbi:hypothetical protein PMZ80_001456 [Knufia obscura]|uniref:Uncharacterized protein n=2 Tax=Knufia TaxID=430999 RepID=A0AAN8EPL1_9EURO|nr:hypothetical protein PMZ80_001456 [Knufia obscura]KAK5955722.1 hypothetical protein OHC33_003363 [Knufia fluminis]
MKPDTHEASPKFRILRRGEQLEDAEMTPALGHQIQTPSAEGYQAAKPELKSDEQANQVQPQSDESDPEDIVVFKGRAAWRAEQQKLKQARLKNENGAEHSNKDVTSNNTPAPAIKEDIDTANKTTSDDDDARIVTTSKGDVVVHGEGPYQWFTGPAEACVEYRRAYVEKHGSVDLSSLDETRP